MKITKIAKVLDLALKARNQNMVFNPLFTGDAGLGKSEIVQQWVKEQQKTDPTFGFIDLRLARMEAPDFIGLPKLVVDNEGRDRTQFILPGFWPEKGTRGVLFLDEVNRTQPSNMSALMQLLTDRKVHDYVLPDGWLIVAAVNPDDSGNYDVSTMDYAFKDRFEIYKVEYDHDSFVNYMDSAGWHDNVRNFVKSGNFIYKDPSEVGTDGQYISPRTLSKINVMEQCGTQADPDLHFETSVAKLGKAIGNVYYKYTFNNRPVTAEDLANKKTSKDAFERLAKYCDPTAYKGDVISVTIQSIVEAYGTNKKVDLKLITDVALLIPQDLAMNFIQDIISKNAKMNEGDITKTIKLKNFLDVCPKLKEAITSSLHLRNQVKAEAEKEKAV